MVVIIDYDIGNLASIKNILKKLNIDSIISREISVINQADIIILPGVGSFDYGINKLKEYNLIECLNHHVNVKLKPTIGICLGMQLMCLESEEGKLPGLGWIDSKVIKFKPPNQNYKVPHMGWNFLNTKNEIFDNSYNEKRFYFVHSYHVEKDCKYSISKTTYAEIEFCSSFNRNNIYGFQFHPEKSHNYGKFLLNNLFKKINERI